MTSLRMIGTTAALLFVAAGLGGCPLTEVFPEDVARSPELGPSDSTGGSAAADADATSEKATALEEFAAGIAEGDAGMELARSFGSTSISTSSDGLPAGVYPPGYNPYDLDNDSSDGAPADEDGASVGSDGSEDGPPGPMFDEGPGTVYSGTVDCMRSETLLGYGEGFDELTYSVTMRFDEEGVPETIPVPVFVVRDLIEAEVRFPRDTDTQQVTFTLNVAFTVTVTVVSAVYTPQTANVVLDIDVSWVGESSSITASGRHTLQTEVAGDQLRYSALTSYEAEFRADDDWMGSGTEKFDCTGTLTLR